MQTSERVESLVGSIRRFGHEGIAYEILGLENTTTHVPVLKIRVLETGEETDYAVADALKDPEEL